MALMTEIRIRHLPVIEAGEVRGVISIGDLVKSIIAEQSSSSNSSRIYQQLTTTRNNLIGVFEHHPTSFDKIAYCVLPLGV
jgi:CBS domain-containing protein